MITVKEEKADGSTAVTEYETELDRLGAQTQAKLNAVTGPRVYAAIANVMADIGASGIAKDRKNTQQGWAFRGIDDVMNAASGPMSARGLVPVPRVISRTQEERVSKGGAPLFWSFLELEVNFFSAEDGSCVTVRTYGEAMDNGDKSTGKAFSYAYRDALVKTFCIPVEGTAGDADSITHEVQTACPLAQASATNAKPAVQSVVTNSWPAALPGSSVHSSASGGPAEPRSTDAQKARIRDLMSGKGISLTDAQGLSKSVTGTAGALTEKQADTFIAALEAFGDI